MNENTMPPPFRQWNWNTNTLPAVWHLAGHGKTMPLPFRQWKWDTALLLTMKLQCNNTSRYYTSVQQFLWPVGHTTFSVGHFCMLVIFAERHSHVCGQNYIFYLFFCFRKTGARPEGLQVCSPPRGKCIRHWYCAFAVAWVLQMTVWHGIDRTRSLPSSAVSSNRPFTVRWHTIHHTHPGTWPASRKVHLALMFCLCAGLSCCRQPSGVPFTEFEPVTRGGWPDPCYSLVTVTPLPGGSQLFPACGSLRLHRQIHHP